MIIILSINNVPDDETNSTRRIPENISVSLSVQIIQHREEKSSFFSSLLVEVREKERKRRGSKRLLHGSRMDRAANFQLANLFSSRESRNGL